MTSVDTGRKAEAAARVYLEMRGYQILEQNWRLPSHEIDIIASKDNVVHFVEVRYRARNEQGSGFDSITASKVKKMQKAAWAWVDENKYKGEYVLSAVEVASPNYVILGFIENVF
jgi:putative endonuclease